MSTGYKLVRPIIASFGDSPHNFASFGDSPLNLASSQELRLPTTETLQHLVRKLFSLLIFPVYAFTVYMDFNTYLSVVCIDTYNKCPQSKKISNDQEPIQSDPISYPQNQKGNN